MRERALLWTLVRCQYPEVKKSSPQLIRVIVQLVLRFVRLTFADVTPMADTPPLPTSSQSPLVAGLLGVLPSSHDPVWIGPLMFGTLRACTAPMRLDNLLVLRYIWASH